VATRLRRYPNVRPSQGIGICRYRQLVNKPLGQAHRPPEVTDAHQGLAMLAGVECKTPPNPGDYREQPDLGKIENHRCFGW
jgi:hypothetical protein